MPTRELMPTFLRLLLTLTLALPPLLPAAWAGTATRSLSSAHYVASQEVTVSVELAPLASEAFNTLEEVVPPGWELVSAGTASWTSSTRTLRWVSLGGLVRTFSYVVRAPSPAISAAVFSGQAAFDGAAVGVGGTTLLPVRPPGTVARSFPGLAGGYRPGVGLAVRVASAPGVGVAVHGVEEVLPEGWTASGISHGGVLAGRKVTWPLFTDDTARELTYTTTPPAGATGDAVFSGTATFDGVAVVTAGVMVLSRAIESPGTLTRSMATTFHTGEAVAVTLVATPGAGVLGYSVREQVPGGWTAHGASHAGTVSADGRVIVWGPFLDSDARALSYEAVPGPGAVGTAAFAGEADFSGTAVAATGTLATTWETLEDGTATRTVPGTARVGVEFEVTVTATPNEHVSLYTVQETVPTGYTVSLPAGTAGSPQGMYSATTRTVTWGPISNEGAATLRYRLTAMEGAATGPFAGTASFGPATVAVDGPTTVSLLPMFAGAATRTLPAVVTPGTVASVGLVATPDAGVGLYVVEEVLPTGWSPATLPAGATWDGTARRVRFGPFNDDAARTLDYTVNVGTGSSGPATFSGTATFNGTGFAVGGMTTTVADAPPVMTALPDQVVAEDESARLMFEVTDDLTEAGSLGVTATSSNEALVPGAGLQVGMGGGGRRVLGIGLAPNQWGTTTITVQASDGRGATTRSFVLTVGRVNDAPTFVKGADRVDWDDAGAVEVPGWATGISAGPADESGQALGFEVETTNAGLFAVTPAISADGTLTYTPREMARGVATVTVRLKDDGGTANGGADTSAAQAFTITVEARPRVVGRWLFYNNSRFDGNNAGLGAADDGAIASNKTALRPGGGTSSFANVSSYSRGINGVMVDMVGLAGTPTAGDFGFRVGRVAELSEWTAGPVPVAVAVRAGAGVGGSDRVTLRWLDSAVRNQWLEVTVKAGGQTGLASAEVFYFGSVVGDVVDSGTLLVTSADVLSVRASARFGLVPVTTAQDVNRDGLVNSTDLLLVRVNQTTTANRVIGITP